jgi:hypothetical protein
LAHRQRIAHTLRSIAIAAVAALAQAQTSPNTPAQTIEDALHQLSDQAGVVFSGEVTAIRHITGVNGASGLVEIEFHIDQGVRGCTSGGTYILREWAGLWAGGDPRYRVGQRLLMFLHTPGANGITSPVGGMAGVIPIRGGDIAPRATDATTAHQPTIADLRWLSTKIQRTAAYSASSAMPQPVATGQTVTATTDTPVNVSAASIPTQQATVDLVIGLLTNWQKAEHALP